MIVQSGNDGRDQLTVLITGASRGLGRELARQYAGDGWRVIAACRDPAAAPQHSGIVPMRLDAGDEASILALSGQLAGDTIDVLINNAAIRGGTAGLSQLAADDFLNVMRVNSLGPLLLVKALLPHLSRGRHGIVANISSRAATVDGLDSDGDYAYRCSKAALNIATAKLALDHDLIFVSLHPGWVKTDMGGTDANVDISESAAGLRSVIANANRKDSGSFKDFRGADLPR